MATFSSSLFTPPCFAAIGAMKSEMKSNKWLLKSVLLQLSVGYIVAMITYQVGTILVYKELAQGFIPAVIILALAVFYVVYKIKSNKVSESEKKVSKVQVQ